MTTLATGACACVRAGSGPASRLQPRGWKGRAVPLTAHHPAIAGVVIRDGHRQLHDCVRGHDCIRDTVVVDGPSGRPAVDGPRRARRLDSARRGVLSGMGPLQARVLGGRGFPCRRGEDWHCHCGHVRPRGDGRVGDDRISDDKGSVMAGSVMTASVMTGSVMTASVMTGSVMTASVIPDQ